LISVTPDLELAFRCEGSAIHIRLTADEAVDLARDLIRLGARHRKREFSSGAVSRWP
jgi:hypothetical protein